MLIKINNRKIVNTGETPVIVLFEQHEIQMIKQWGGEEDILFSHPSGWTKDQSDKFMDKRKPELVALHATNQRNAAEEKAQFRAQNETRESPPPACMHGVVQQDGKPECPECTKIAKAMGVDKKFFESSAEIEQLEGEGDGSR